MPLEAVMLCLDNSEWMRNGDYLPSRLDVQTEACNYIASLKHQANVENSVGVLTMAGKRVDVRLTPSVDLGDVLTALNGVTLSGNSNFLSALKTAQLCLKNRANKNQRQRIIAFVGSPLDCPVKELVKLGKHLKKHNVAVDLVNFGLENTENENTEKLDAFIQAVSSDNNSKMVVIPPGPHNFVDIIVSTILVDEQGNAPSVPMAGVEGIDASMDPELAEAIRMSLEAERERVEREQQKQQAEQQASSGTAPAERTEGSSSTGAAGDVQMEDEMDEETAMALAMSMQQFDADGDTVMNESKAEEKTSSTAADINIEKALQDPNFVDDLLSDLNVSKDDVNIDEILNSLNTDSKPKKDNNDSSKK